MYRNGTRVGAIVMLVAGLGVAISGDLQGKVMTEVQPMKMAAAEALYDTEQPAAFSVFTVGTLDGSKEKFAVKIPGLLSFLATGSTHGEVVGINQLRAQYQRTYGTDPGAAYYSGSGYTPLIPLTYWTFRLMIGLGLTAAAFGGWVLWATRRDRTQISRPLFWAAMSVPFLPLLANATGWIFTEMGRQPWAVFGLMTTAKAVSPGVSATDAFISLAVLTLLYAVLAVIEVRLMLTYIRRGAEALPPPPDEHDDTADRPLAFAY